MEDHYPHLNHFTKTDTHDLNSIPDNIKTVLISPFLFKNNHRDDNFLIFPDNDVITPDVDVGVDLDFLVNVDCDFTSDDISFADDLLLDPNSDPVVFGSEEVVRVCDLLKPDSNSEPNSSEGSNFAGNSDLLINYVDISNDDCDDKLEFDREIIRVYDCEISNQISSNNCSISSDSVPKSKRKEEIEHDHDRAVEIRVKSSGGGGNSVSKSRRKKEIEQDHAVEDRVKSSSGGGGSVSKSKRKKEIGDDYGCEIRSGKFRKTNEENVDGGEGESMLKSKRKKEMEERDDVVEIRIDKVKKSSLNVSVDNVISSDENVDRGGGEGFCVGELVLRSEWKKEMERDYDVETRTDNLRRSVGNGNASVVGILSDEGFSVGGGGGDEDERRKARLIRNRESAHLSRQRKKKYVDELEDKVKLMVSTITDLNGRISYFMSENATLRQQLSGGVVGPPPPGMYPAHPMQPMGYPWMPCPPGYMVQPQGSHVPLVPIPRLKPQQPTPAPKVKKSKEKGESKTKKVASVSLFGWLFFMLLFGGLVPMVNVRYGRVGDGVQKGTVFTVDKHTENTGHVDARFGHGRVLQQSNSSNGGHANASDPLVASLYVPRNDKLIKIDGNLIIHSVLASEKALASQTAKGPKVSKETGLAIHGSYPPYPTPGPGSNNWRRPHLDRNQNGRQRAIASGSADGFTPIGSDGKLQQWFREGLAGPMLSSGMCTEVFQFDISPTHGSIVPATSVTNITSEDRLNSTLPNKTINRRILHKHAIPLKDDTHNTTEEHIQPREQNDGFQNNRSHPSVVVSVLVDPREVGDGDSESVIGSKSLSRIFVVVLIDSVKYVTYSCMLPFMGSGSHLITT